MASPIVVPAHRAVAVTLAFTCLAFSAFAQPSAQPAPVHRQPVLVELFTSEGCSDCPPADALLARLDSTQFVPDAHAIVLSEHVTYWNRQGWTDPFSLDSMDRRQSEYALHFSLNDVYTPQMVVDGAQQFTGSDAAALSHAVASAASTSKQQIAIENPHWTGTALSFSVHVPANSGATLFAALADDATHSEVARGENAGRTLHHVAVVRVLKEFDSKFADGQPLQLSRPGQTHADNAAGPLRLVVFLADRHSGHVVAAAEQTINR